MRARVYGERDELTSGCSELEHILAGNKFGVLDDVVGEHDRSVPEVLA